MSTILATNKNIRAANRYFFENSGMREGKGIAHHPFIVFKRTDKRINVEVVEDPVQLLTFPPRTKVIAQWKGKRKSNFFRFTVGQLKKYISDNPAKGRQKI
jgi:hypothetical protein